MQISMMDTETGEMIVKRVSVPIGLEELMEGLTKEILLKKPADIYLFAAEYFAQLLLLREKGGFKVKSIRTAQSVARQVPKQPSEKLIIRGASKQLSRQISVRGESPVKRVVPTKKSLPGKDHKDDKNVERSKFIDRKNKSKHAEPAENKTVETKPKHVISRTTSENFDILNKRDRSVSSSRRGRSVTKSVQSTPRQKSTSTPRRTQNVTENGKLNKPQNKDDTKQQTTKTQNDVKENTFVPKISSVEEDQAFIKDGKLAATPPKIIKRPQVPESNELISSLIVPQVVEKEKSKKEIEDLNLKVAEHKTHEKGEIVVESSNKEHSDSQIKDVTNDDQRNEVLDETHDKIDEDLNNTSSISIEDFNTETKSLFSMNGEATPTNVDDKILNELKSIDSVEKHDDSPGVNNSDNTSDDQITNLLTDDSSASEILDKKIEDKNLTKNEDKPLSNIEENDKSNSLPSEVDNNINVINDGSNLTFSVSNGSDKIENSITLDHQGILQDESDATSAEPQSELAEKNIISEGNESEKTKSSTEETISDGDKNIKKSKDTEYIFDENQEKNHDGYSSEKILEVVQDVHQHDDNRDIKHDKDIENDTNKEEPTKDININEKENSMFDSKKDSTDPDSHNKNNIDQNEKDSLKQQVDTDKGKVDHKYSNKGVDAEKKQIGLHENVLESGERGNIDLSIHNKENIEDQIEENSKTISSNLKDEPIAKHIPEIRSIEQNLENDINLTGTENAEIEPIRVKREAVALNDSAVNKISDGVKITQATESEDNKLKVIEKDNINVQINANKMDSTKSEINEKDNLYLKDENAEKISSNDGKSHHVIQKSSDSLSEEQHDGTILPDSGKNHLKDQDEMPQGEKIPNSDLTAERIELDKEQKNVVTKEEENSNCVTDSVSIDEKKANSKGNDENILSRTESEAKKAEVKESSDNNEELTSLRPNINVVENIEDKLMADKENTKEPMKEHLIENISAINKDTKGLLNENFDVDDTTNPQDKEINGTTKLDDNKMKVTEEIDKEIEKSTSSISNEDTPVIEKLDKVPKDFDDKIESVNIVDTTKQIEKTKTESILLESDNTKNNKETENENDKENTSSQSEELNNIKNTNEENEELQNTKNIISTDSVTNSSDVNKEKSDNKEAEKQEKYTKIEEQEAVYDKNAEHMYKSEVNETDNKTNVDETPVNKDENTTVLVEVQNKNSEQEIVSSAIDTDHDKEASISNKEMSGDDSMKDNDTNSLSELDPDKPTTMSELESKHSESDLQKHDTKDSCIESINSVINVAKEGPVDHVVKKYIGDFIQQEQQHVFAEHSKQMEPKYILDENTNSKELSANIPIEKNESSMEKIPVERNEVLTIEDNKFEPPKLETQDVNKLTKNGVMKNIVNSTISLAQTGKVDEILKVHIKDFLGNEKNNVFTANSPTINTSDSLAEGHQKQSTIHEIENDIKEANDKPLETENKISELITRKDSSKSVIQSETQSQKIKQSGKNIKSRSATQANIKVQEENSKQNNKNKAEKKLRRVKTVDVLTDLTKPKTEVKSRIPTADYRNRVKREKENGKHSIIIKQTSNSQEVVNKLPGKVNSVNKIDNSTTDNKQVDEIVKEHTNGNIEHKNHEEAEVQQSSKDLKEAELSELNKSGFDNSRLREELKAVEAESKFATFKPSFNPYVLRQEIKNASPSDVKNDEFIGNDESDNFLTQIVAALKIQAVWRGFKVRKNKASITLQQTMEPEAVIENKASQLMLQNDRNIKGKDVTETDLKPDGVVTEKEDAKIENDESKRIRSGSNTEENLNSEESQNQEVTESSRLGDSKMTAQKTDIEMIAGNKDSQLLLQGHESNSVQSDSTATEKQDTNIESNNESKSDLIKSEGNQISRKLNSQESQNQDQEHSQLENLHKDSNKINEDKFIEAAVIIQKIWRAFKVRKNMKQKYQDEKSNQKNNESFKKSEVNKVNVENGIDTVKPERDSSKSESSHVATEKFTKAAIIIQKVWRGFKIRKNIKENDKNECDLTVKDNVTELNNSKSKETPEQSRTGTTETKTENQSADFSLPTDEKFRKAALTIQRIWRGFNARKALKQNNNQENSKTDHQAKPQEHFNQINKDENKKELTDGHEVVNKKVVEHLKSEPTPKIATELSDPKNDNKLMRAAIKIQTLWRGFQVRKVLKVDNKQAVSTDQGNIERSNGTSEITTGKSEEKLEKPSEAGKDEFIKAAIKIQKIWRGFKVRKVLKRGDTFGTRVESEKPVIESIKTEEEIHPKDKKSALKIQSLWRGYQVRKNINIIKDKLEENITANDVVKGKELTDGDILNAATKIQAGVRGYLQRKKYKREVSNLKSIAEEDIEEKHDAKNEEAVSATSELLMKHKSTESLKEEPSLEGRQLSEDEVSKALEDLNKLEVPNDIPLVNEIEKPTLHKSHTVQESEIAKKQSSPLLQTVSLSKINNTEEDTEIRNKNQTTDYVKDSNNNSSNNFTPLEIEAKEGIQNITKPNGYEVLSGTPPPSYEEAKAKSVSDSKTLIGKDTKQLDSNEGTHLIQGQLEENIDSKVTSNLHTKNMDATNNKIQPDTSNENILYEATNQKSGEDADNHETDKLSNTLSKTKSNSNISLPENQQTEVNKLVNVDSASDGHHSIDLQHDEDKMSSKTNENKNYHAENNMNKDINEPKESTDLKFDESSSKTDSKDLQSSSNKRSEFVHVDRDELPNDEQTSKAVNEKLMHERPVSIESTDSAITVIDNELSSDIEENNNENEGEIKDSLPEGINISAADDNTRGTLLEHENLINDFQNKLLDQISGKNGEKTSAEEVNRKFNIEQLRKELEEAGLTYNSDDTFNIQHQNSKEESNAHDQLFDYLHNLESVEPDNEENSNTILSPRDLPDIKEEELDTKSVGDNRLEESNIALDENAKPNIVESIKAEKSGGEIDIEKLQSTLKECENIAHEINKGIKITEAEQPSNEITTSNGIENKYNTLVNDTNQIESGTAFCEIPQRKTVVDKHIDNRPLSDHIELVNVNTNSDISTNKANEHVKLESDNIPTDLSSTKEPDQTNSSSGSGLLHTGELHDSVLVSLPSTSETDSQYPDSLENMNTELSSQDASLTSTTSSSKLLHTGEFHDTVVVPLPVKVKDDLKTEIEEQGNSISHTISNDSGELDSMQISLPSITTENIKSGELKTLTTSGLLHTGELHDSVVVPLSIEAQHVLGKANEQKEISPLESTKTIPSEGELTEMGQQNLTTNEPQREPSAPTYTRLLHTGELHDPVVIPMPALDRHTISTGDSEDGSNQPEKAPRQVDSECQTTGQVHAVPIEVQLNQAPAGVAVLTSPRPISAVDGVSSVEDGIAQTPDKGALPIESGSDFSSPSDIQSMESETRKNATNNNKSMEVEAATKIQAGFRGYQVRKQLKLKNGSSDINNQRRQLRRKSSGRITDNGRISQNKTKDPNDIEEKSAVKIQAGVRGFLVRRRQKKQKTQES